MRPPFPTVTMLRTRRAGIVLPALAFVLWLLLLIRSGALGTVIASSVVVAVKVKAPPPQDASFRDPIWATAVRARVFEDATTRQPAHFATMALLLYDDKNLYVGFIAKQRGIPLTKTQISNDVGYGLDDEVTISIDPSDNNSRVYTFTSTPTGVRYESSSESTRYQAPWKTVSKVTSDGYNVLMTIPLTDMRISNRETQQWRFNFSRYIAAESDLLTWAYDPQSNAYCSEAGSAITVYCDSTRWPVLSGITLLGIERAPPPYADIYALASAGRDKDIFEAAPQTFTKEAQRNLGLEATVPLSRAVAFVATIGPDFSNIESDQTTIVPQEFALQYTEYRPFFSQGSNYISSLPDNDLNGPANQMFYSPSLGLVDSGYKVEGTSGETSFGLLSASGANFDDQASGFAFTKPDGTLSLSFEGVGANHPGLTDRTIGFGGYYQNLHSGLQPIFAFEQETGTIVSRPALARSSYIGEVTNHGSWETGLFYNDIGPKFGPVDGYTSIQDVRGPEAFTTYSPVTAQQSIIKSYRLSLSADRFIDDSGAAHKVDTSEDMQIVLKDLLSLGITSGASELRSYSQAYPSYKEPRDFQFDATSFALSYRDGTPSPTDLSYTFGPYAVRCIDLPVSPLPCQEAVDGYSAAYTQQFSLSTTRAFSGGYSVTVNYAGTIEHPFSGESDTQHLRRIGITHALGSDSQISLALRDINGTGGNAAPGESLAVSYHKRFTNQSQLYVEYGSPDSYRTLQRLIVKYIYHLGAGAAGS